MSDSAARDQDAAETESAFSHPVVAPDVSAAYGSHPDQVIDFYAPRDGRAGAPVVVVLHGGAWRAPYDRLHISPFADFLARRGFAVASVEYRRGSELPQQRGSGPVAGRWPETFDDVAAAMDALPELLARHMPSADARRTVVTGHSAGGQLALWAAARKDGAVPVAGVCGQAAVCELTTAGAARELMGGTPAEVPERYAQCDPIQIVPLAVPILLVHGADDATVPVRRSRRFAEAARAAGDDVTLIEPSPGGHRSHVDSRSVAWRIAADWIASRKLPDP